MSKRKVAKVLTYTAVFEPADDGGYVVTVPALPGCLTQGENFEDAKEMVKDAITGYLAVLKKEGEDIPEESQEVVISKIEVPQPSF